MVLLGPSEEVPVTTTGGTILETSTLAITSTVPTTSTTTTATGAEMASPRSFLPNGSPSRPTATVTCRPQTWVQRISEGWTSAPPPDDTKSGDSDLHGPSLSVEEEVPENLGCEWRVLHPFELPGVRYPTETTPPNQRRLAENDALVELIQTTEYLEDIPMWGQRNYQLYPPRYGDPFYRGRGRGRGRGRREMMSENLMKETQPKVLEEAQLGDLLEGEMVEDFISKGPWKEMSGIVKQRNGQTL